MPLLISHSQDHYPPAAFEEEPAAAANHPDQWRPVSCSKCSNGAFWCAYHSVTVSDTRLEWAAEAKKQYTSLLHRAQVCSDSISLTSSFRSCHTLFFCRSGQAHRCQSSSIASIGGSNSGDPIPVDSIPCHRWVCAGSRSRPNVCTGAIKQQNFRGPQLLLQFAL